MRFFYFLTFIIFSFNIHASGLSTWLTSNEYTAAHFNIPEESRVMVLDYDANSQYIIETVRTQYDNLITTKHPIYHVRDLSVVLKGKNGYNDTINRPNLQFDIFLQGDFTLSQFQDIDLLVFKINGVEYKSYNFNQMNYMKHGNYSIIKIGETEKFGFTETKLISLKNQRMEGGFTYSEFQAYTIDNYLVKELVDSQVPMQVHFNQLFYQVDRQVVMETGRYVFVPEFVNLEHKGSTLYKKSAVIEDNSGVTVNLFLNPEKNQDHAMRIYNKNRYVKDIVVKMDGFILAHSYSKTYHTYLMNRESVRLEFF